MSNYFVCLASNQLSGHEKFEDALEAYSKVAHRVGANIRGPNGDDECDGFTEDEKIAIEEVEHEAFRRIKQSLKEVK